MTIFSIIEQEVLYISLLAGGYFLEFIVNCVMIYNRSIACLKDNGFTVYNNLSNTLKFAALFIIIVAKKTQEIEP